MAQTHRMRHLPYEQLGGVAEPPVAVRGPHSVRQGHEPSKQAKQAVQLTTAAASGKLTSSEVSERTRAGPPARVDSAVVAEWLKRQCEPYGRGPTITNPQALRRTRDARAYRAGRGSYFPPLRLHLDGVRVELAPTLRVS
jgi:hypothetical protein